MIRTRIEYKTETLEDNLKKFYGISSMMNKSGFYYSFSYGHGPMTGENIGTVEFVYGMGNTAPNREELGMVVEDLRKLGFDIINAEIKPLNPEELA